jgi:hypothetical protein
MNGTKSSTICKKKYRHIKKEVDNHVQYCKTESERSQLKSIVVNTGASCVNTDSRLLQNSYQCDLTFNGEIVDNNNGCSSLACSSKEYDEVVDGRTDWRSDDVAHSMSYEGGSVQDEVLSSFDHTIAYEEMQVYDDELNILDLASGSESGDFLDHSSSEINEFQLNVVSQSNISIMPDFLSELRSWALKYNIRHSALNVLLSILSKHHEVPKDSRTLLRTKNTHSRNEGLIG